MAARGSVYRRGKTWTAHVSTGGRGRQRQVKEGGFATERQAQQRLTEILSDLDDGTFVTPSKRTVETTVKQWLASLPSTGRKATTVDGYRSKLEGYLVPELGAVLLQDLSPLDLDQLYRTLLDRPVSRQTVLSTHRVIHTMLADAVRKGLVVRNVAELASAPRASSARGPEMKTWTPDELRVFLERTEDETHGRLYRVAAMTGVRRSELVGLRWADVDLDAGAIRIRQRLVRVKGKTDVDTPKTKRSERTIDLDPMTVATLKAHRHEQRELRLLVGPGWTDHDLVFCGPDGTPANPDAIGKAFARAVKRHGLPTIRFHDLRHTHATHLLVAGVNIKVVSERLGHASVSFTLDTYGHVLPGQQAEAAAAVAALVDG
jgi:integrase